MAVPADPKQIFLDISTFHELAFLKMVKDPAIVGGIFGILLEELTFGCILRFNQKRVDFYNVCGE